jgi:hypothetical protein
MDKFNCMLIEIGDVVKSKKSDYQFRILKFLTARNDIKKKFVPADFDVSGLTVFTPYVVLCNINEDVVEIRAVK